MNFCGLKPFTKEFSLSPIFLNIIKEILINFLTSYHIVWFWIQYELQIYWKKIYECCPRSQIGTEQYNHPHQKAFKKPNHKFWDFIGFIINSFLELALCKKLWWTVWSHTLQRNAGYVQQVITWSFGMHYIPHAQEHHWAYSTLISNRISNTVPTGRVLQQQPQHWQFNRCLKCNQVGEDRLHVVMCWDKSAEIIWPKQLEIIRHMKMEIEYTHLTSIRKTQICSVRVYIEDWNRSYGWLNFLSGFWIKKWYKAGHLLLA
jgi:hypothetical protein